MVQPILLITLLLAAVSMAAPTAETGADLTPKSVEVDSGEGNTIQKRSFAATCWGCMMGAGTTLLCECSKAGGGGYRSTLVLNTCLGNADGWLTWRSNGYFLESCRDMRYDAGSTRLHVTCRTISGNWNPSSVVLDEHIHNSNGQLWC